MDLAKLALTGLIGGALTLSACTGPTEIPSLDKVKADAAATVDGVKADAAATVDGVKADAAAVVDKAAAYMEIHDCAGKNTCKGLGGCKVTDESLAAMGKKMGVEGAALGKAHGCKGMNSCKGLGGCSVDAEKLAALKANLAGGAAGH